MTNSTQIRRLALQTARRLAIEKQGLAAHNRPSDKAGILRLVQELGCLQLDPISVVTRSERMVLWSRLGEYDPALLEELRWKDRALFDYWAHAASIVPTADYSLHAPMMRSYGQPKSAWAREVFAWIERNQALRDHVLSEIRGKGALPTSHFEDKTERRWESSGWNDGRNVGRMLEFLWMQGVLVIGGRSGSSRLWDVAERWFPEGARREALSAEELTRSAAERALRALGVARKRDIERHFLRGRYAGLADALRALETSGTVARVELEGAGAGPWYVHAEDLSRIERIEAGEWAGRTTLLSPFDNLICDRDRTQLLFGFEFRVEIYVPKAKRRWGYYVLPVLHGDRLIGRVDTALDRKAGRLEARAVHTEADAPRTKAAAEAVHGALLSLARWLGAREIAYGQVDASATWRRALRNTAFPQ